MITVGADDIGGHERDSRRLRRPRGRPGATRYDGFAKPELAAPGRYMIGPVPTARRSHDPARRHGRARLHADVGHVVRRAGRLGRGRDLLALHPNWTPDQVKGALMVSAKPAPNATPGSVGVGLVNLANATQVGGRAAEREPGTRQVRQPADPHRLDPGLRHRGLAEGGAEEPELGRPTWESAAWGSAAWGSAAWGSAAWGSAAWGSAAWGSAAWGSILTSRSHSLPHAAWGSPPGARRHRRIRLG